MNQETTLPAAEPPECRCGGTGAYTAEIPLADAVVLVHRLCLDHLARRTRVRDTTTGRTGEVMDIIKTSQGARVYLRPPEGGKEWTANGDALEPLPGAA